MHALGRKVGRKILRERANVATKPKKCFDVKFQKDKKRREKKRERYAERYI